jgi:hypothetical protein
MSEVKIFVSHSRRDSAVAEKIAQAVQGVGRLRIVTFLDKDLKPGDDFRKATDVNLRSADAVLAVVASPDAARNSWMDYEVGAAEALGKPIIVLASNRHSLSEFPEGFRSFPVVVFDPDEPEGAAKEIVGRINLLDAV